MKKGPDRIRRACQGLVLALGAPAGWLAIRGMQGFEPLSEIAGQPWLYAYMLAGTSLAFGLFGYLLGRHEEKLETISITDPLTGLRNRRYFQERLEEECGGARRHGRPLSLLELDLDFFKKVNDAHGHPAGDRLLAVVAAVLKGHVRKGETLARIGGEEFAVILPGVDGRRALKVAERIRRSVRRARIPVRAGKHLGITVSLGLASLGRGQGGGTELYARADRALYQAKRGGRDRVAWA